VFGVLFFTHGLDKMMNFTELVNVYPSVLGFGSYMTLMVTIFCEFCCSLFLIAGLLVRLMTVPMIIAMGVAFFDIHDAILPEGELALIYFIVFIILFLTGPGRYSIDFLIDGKIRSANNNNT
jgi:putative oxidoreductase